VEPASVLVTGAAGFVGSHLAERLAADGHRVLAVDCLTDYYDVSQKRASFERLAGLAGCRLRTDDLRTGDLDALLQDIEVVFHQAGQPGVRASWDAFASYVEHNVEATQRLLAAAARRGVRRFVYASSSSVYGDATAYPTREDQLPRPVSPYGVTKLAAEHLCGVYATNFSVPTVSLRYFTVYGPRQRPDMAMHRMIEAEIAGDRFPVYGDGRQVRDFTFVADVVEANLRAGFGDITPGTVLNVAGGTSATLLDVAALVEELSGRTLTLAFEGPQRGDVVRTGGSIERAAALLDWAPLVGLREGLAAQVAWHRERAALRAPA
jgi:nucleoside-diphosphate-sugar epimerase